MIKEISEELKLIFVTTEAFCKKLLTDVKLSADMSDTCKSAIEKTKTSIQILENIVSNSREDLLKSKKKLMKLFKN